MRPEIAAAALALALGQAAAADARPMDATCRTMTNGAVSRVCRWRVGQGHTVDIYYGEPGKRAASQPPPAKAAAPPPPAYPTPTAYADYGYGYPYVLLTPERGFGERGLHGRDRPIARPGELRDGRHIGFRGEMLIRRR